MKNDQENKRHVRAMMLATTTLLAVVALVVGCAGGGGGDTDPRLAKPGNYIVVGPGAACELRAVPDDGSCVLPTS